MCVKSIIINQLKAFSILKLGDICKSMNKVLLVVSLFLSTGLYSQTIINAERLSSTKDSLAFALQLNYSGNRGNAVTDKLKIAHSCLSV